LRAPPGPPDNELVARVLARDDRHAFAVLVRRHQASVRELLRRLTAGDQALADDLAQETFLRAYHALGSFRGEAKLSSWLLRIAHRIFLSDARAAAARRVEALDDPRDPPEPADVVARHDLAGALRLLSAEERAALALTYAEDLSHEEAAAILDWPLGTLKTRILHAKEKLRARLLPEVP
jgi:RNA polymerase sigma factor (sigma-70 family)